jgi:hypothetical protein
MREDGIGLCVKENKQRQKQCKNATAGLRLGGVVAEQRISPLRNW